MTLTKDIAKPSDNRVTDVTNFTTTLKWIMELLELEEEDDYGILKPTEYAFQTAMQLVVEAYEFLGNRFPRSSNSSTDEAGGIILTWKNYDKTGKVMLFCPASSEEAAFIYHKTPQQSAAAVDKEVSSSKLAYWLEGLVSKA
ncbi:MAG: hypothetical protein F6J93_09665 [Oscillatoria sp. SIO1A7]|nr:hypothetical protein [Oscillatoria sp. SIO1A7]